MSMSMRAAQFSPFAALTGHGAAISETERLTDKKIELDEYAKTEIDLKLQYIRDHITEEIVVTVAYFIPDERKAGGRYKTVSGEVTGIISNNDMIIIDHDIQINYDDILMLESDIFRDTF